ncbi:hypothetical protein Hamer_G024905 [Homarus americanus]|uniref:Uncharacterized protein n=1 Tax=Homarus americanus TaxID=6706 RepID=A0A8J5N849_HOMAM|nr:hypothetical protein Hamer_G024905 [Homarus americanus]
MNAVRYYTMPRLHAPQYGVRFNNVITTTGQILNNMWVVELYAIPHMEHYYNPVNDMNYYIRHDIHTKASFTDFCEAVVTRASKPYEKEVSHPGEGVKLLKQVLEERVWTYPLWGLTCVTSVGSLTVLVSVSTVLLFSSPGSDHHPPADTILQLTPPSC